MGFRVGDVCYPTSGEALDHFYSLASPSMAPATTTAYTTFTNVGGVWQMAKYSINSSGVWSLNYSTTAPVVNFASCTVLDDATTQFTDGVTLGWGVAAAMVAAWSIKFLADRLK